MKILFIIACLSSNFLGAGLIDRRATQETKHLYQTLKSIGSNALLFGMHDATGYGVGWRGDEKRSDVKAVCGDYPAVFSWDAMDLFHTSDSIISSLRNKIQFAYNKGGINTICWHQGDPQYNEFYAEEIEYEVVPAILSEGKYHKFYKNKLDKLGRFAKSLQDTNGKLIPIIFRPYHEQNGDWFWWGKMHRTEQEYIELWRFTVNYLKDSLQVRNFIYAFSPDGNQYKSKAEYLIDYPGDDYVDMLGLDFYFPNGSKKRIKAFQRKCIHIVEYAREKDMIAAVTEAGSRLNWEKSELLINNWFTSCILEPIKRNSTAREIIYVAVWRNASKKHHFAPYPGHQSEQDFMDFYNDPFTAFLKDLKGIYESNNN